MSSVNTHGVQVYGAVVDAQTRCAHYATALDVIAIRFFCCGQYFPCHLCHQETSSHEAQQWPVARQDEQAVLCGVCGRQLSVSEYGQSSSCPECSAEFNPGCKLHWELYFQR